MDGVLDIYDLGVVITHLIPNMSGRAQEGEAPPPPRKRAAGRSPIPPSVRSRAPGPARGLLGSWQSYRDDTPIHCVSTEPKYSIVRRHLWIQR
jgi:hypothetical protein